MGGPKAVLDASVLFQEPIRSLLLWTASEGAYTPCWTERILVETRDSLIRKGAVTKEQWIGLRNAMTEAFPEAELDQNAVNEIEPAMPNHPKDRHVLAAAVAGDAELVVTNNQRHFSPGDLASVGKRSLDADGFLCELIARLPNLVHGALILQVTHMRNPRQWTLAELTGRLKGQGPSDPLAPAFADQLERRFSIKPLPPPSM